MVSQNDIKNAVFLLGGKDLEMKEISRLLKKSKIKLYDRKLSWGAQLSVYSDLFNNSEHFFGIELVEDIETPANYTRIDHHNELWENPSSLEQVADLLGLRLTRKQKLIVANDTSYIPGMIKLGATEQEIRMIRKHDRRAQGVTLADERAAADSIKYNKSEVDDLIIVKAKTNRFSAITDVLFPFSKLLIYTENELTYYGEYSKLVTREYQELIDKKSAFSGGKGNGYFGLVRNKFTPEQIIVIKTKITELVTN
jgi:hypothetical protein